MIETPKPLTTPKAGRPKRFKSSTLFKVRFETEALAEAQEVAAEIGCTFNEFVRKVVAEKVARIRGRK